MQNYAAEVLCVTVWISQLISDRVQEQVSSFMIQVNSKILEYVDMSAAGYVGCTWNLILATV